MGRRKDVLLLVLAVVALGVAFYTFRGKPASPGAAPAAATAPQPKKEEAKKEETGGGPGLPSAALPGGGTRNPFQGPEGGAAPAGRNPATAPQKPAGAPAPASQPAVNPLPVPARPLPAAPGSAKTQAPAATLALNGIVAGKQAMAVIREGDQRYYVKVGDRIGDRYRVQSISSKEVVLVGSEGKVILRMGGRQ